MSAPAIAPALFQEPAARDRVVCGCENPYHGHDAIPCQAPAVVIVTQHSFDECIPHPRLDDNGDVTVPICADCWDQVRIECGTFLRRIHAMRRDWCLTCNSPLRRIGDVFRRVVPL